MNYRTTRSIAVLATVVALGAGIPAVASAGSTTTTTPSASFVSGRQTLETQLASRVTRLQHLVADVTEATSLSANASTTLQARLSSEEGSMNALIAKVPTDTTQAQLSADRATMYKDNRVYAVMSPQVFESIEASVVAEQVTTMQGNEVTLQTEAASLIGLAGYENALNHYDNYVKRISNWSTRILTVEDAVLAQTPQGFPRNTNVFVAENHSILTANIALAYAGYDASVIGLASGGYTGS
ncbi:MAG: hypothetical protein WA359_03160 [Acidimicrobiales bacterium]